MDGRLIGVKLDLVIRGTGSIRSPSEHIRLLSQYGPDTELILYGTEAPADPEFETAVDPESLGRAVEAAAGEQLVVYGDEHVLTLAQHMSVETVWIVLGRGANTVREVWRLRGNHPWLGGRRFCLLLEDEEMSTQVDRSTLLATGRVAQVLTMPAVTEHPVMAEVAAASFADPVETLPYPVAAELEPQPVAGDPVERAEAETSQAGGTQIMAEERKAPGKGAVIEHERETEQALLSRYTLVRERRNLQKRLPQVEEALNTLLREIFTTRFAANAEAAAAMEDLARKLAHTAAEFRELVVEKERVEHELEKLSWLKSELEM